MSLLDDVRRWGAQAALHGSESGSVDADELARRVKVAVSAKSDDAALDAWDEAGRSHDPETLDLALRQLGLGDSLLFFGHRRRGRTARSARHALAATKSAGTLRLAAAVLGEVGDRRDAGALEDIAVHPDLTLHAATALANLRHDDGRLALLRLLSRTHGASRVLVIDRLLPFCAQPAVRLALVRDAFEGLDNRDAREVAPAVAEALSLGDWLEDSRVTDDLRAAVRHILTLAGREAG